MWIKNNLVDTCPNQFSFKVSFSDKMFSLVFPFKIFLMRVHLWIKLLIILTDYESKIWLVWNFSLWNLLLEIIEHQNPIKQNF